MRILLLTHTPIDASGSGLYIRRVAEALFSSGHSVGWICPARTEYGHSLILYRPGEDTTTLASLPFDFPTFSGHRESALVYSDLSGSQVDSVVQSWRIAILTAVNLIAPDVIHVNHAFLIAFACAEIGAIPYVLVSHGSEFLRSLDPRFRRYQKVGAASAKRLVAITTEIAGHLAQAAGRSKSEVSVIPPGYDPSVFHVAAVDREKTLSSIDLHTKGPYVGYFGRLVEYKRVGDLLTAVSLMPAASRPELLIVGDGVESEALKFEASSLGLQASFVPHVSDPIELANLIRAVDVLVLTSSYDPYPMIAIEAVACGTPILTSDSCGVVDLVPPSAVFPTGDTAELSNLILKAVSDRPKSAHESTRTESISGKTWANISQSLLAEYIQATGPMESTDNAPAVSQPSRTIVAAEAGDADALLALWREAGHRLSPSDTCQSIERFLQCPNNLIAIVREGQSIRASVMVADDSWRANIYRLVVDAKLPMPSIWRSSLVAHCLTWAQLRGVTRVQAFVDADTSWLNMGFQADSRTTRWFADIGRGGPLE
jgi:glycosyltransferase involved in cell wall biosynthesis